MDMSHNTLADRFEGALLGATVADALAFPYQHYSRAFLQSFSTSLALEFEEHHSHFYPVGQYSDDAQIMLSLVEALASEADFSAHTALNYLSPLWRHQLLVECDPTANEVLGDWVRTGSLEPTPLRDGHAEIGPLSRAVGPALLYHDQPAKLAGTVEIVTQLTHTDSRVLACAAGFAAGIASNLNAEKLVLGEFLDCVASGARRHDAGIAAAVLDFPRVLSLPDFRALRHFTGLCPDERYPTAGDGSVSSVGLTVYCVPGFLVAIYYFLKSPNDYTTAVDRCLRLGGHIDTPCFLIGALAGALDGTTTIPENLRSSVLQADELRSQSIRLFDRWRGLAGTP